ncbi:HAD-IA family hydrolase [Nocardiopsis sediminis]|uniref:HAD-IA family hydrolase n=1 Tax=Nocardiopsis sediminis TaxID=1778267 RepID=A0ABV8FUK3_9ACTN
MTHHEASPSRSSGPRTSGTFRPFGVRLLTFDVVGTLIDFEAGILASVARLAGRTGARHPDRAVLEAYARAERIEGRRNPQATFTDLLDAAYPHMAAELRLPPYPDPEDTLRAGIPHWPAFPDAVDALAALRHRFRLVALTNADAAAARAMAATLGDPFHDLVTPDIAGAAKPDPRIFSFCHARQSAHGHSRADWLHVAQSQYHDIGVATRLGLRTCWIERRHEKPGFGATPRPDRITAPDLHFPSLGGLLAALGVE